MYPCASSAFPNAEDAYAGVAYFAAIFLPALPVPYFPRSVSCSPVPISLHAKIGRVILRGVPACVMPRRSFSHSSRGRRRTKDVEMHFGVVVVGAGVKHLG